MPDQEPIIIVDAEGNEHEFPAGFNPKRAAAIVRNKGSAALPTKPVSAEDFAPAAPTAGTLAKNVVIGGLKGLGSTLAGLGELATNAGIIPGVAPGSLLEPSLRHPIFQRAEAVTTPTNEAQRVGRNIETALELAGPAAGAAKAIPKLA